MKLEIALIRNGQAQEKGKRLIGVTDEPLSAEGKRQICSKKSQGIYPEASLVFSSGLARCLETARIIYPTVPIVITKELCAPDYGDFEGKLYTELFKDKSFERWVNSSRAQACPNGEEPYALTSRSVAAFRKITDEMAGKGLERGAIISHKMVIQAVLQRFHIPRSSYIDWDISHSGGFILMYDTITDAIEITVKF